MIYLDASYILKCYLDEPGTTEVLALVHNNRGCSSSLHGRVEFWAGVHRHLRENRISSKRAQLLWQQFRRDERDGIWHWFELNHGIIRRACESIETLASNIFLRSGDALHLACAAGNGFSKIYSSDPVLLGAASHFGLTGINVY